MRYQVTWGDESATVDADNESDAWAEFCKSNTLAQQHPKAFERDVVEIDEVEPAEEVVVSPVFDQNAIDARDSISRMTSVEKLQAIVDTDPRITVVEAAKHRLESLHGDNT